MCKTMSFLFNLNQPMFDVANVSLNVIILLLRVSVVFLLYFFLWQVLRVVLRDLRTGGLPAADTSRLLGQLVVVNAGPTGLAVGKSFPLSQVNMIGRSVESDIALNDTFMSADHARLERRGDQWILEDLHSTNGTFVNGFEVRDATSVNVGDIIRVGRVDLKLTA